MRACDGNAVGYLIACIGKRREARIARYMLRAISQLFDPFATFLPHWALPRAQDGYKTQYRRGFRDLAVLRGWWFVTDDLRSYAYTTYYQVSSLFVSESRK